ncbi:MAG: hypothetical protein RLZZ488_1115 [Pseudomonadota bacterium]|jgi:hypothetical protein
MELTNLIWHLGAALAAFWAAIAYRALNARHIELRRSVLVSLLPLRQQGTSDSLPAPVLQRRSLRLRTLRWVAEELRVNYGFEVVVDASQELLELDQPIWSAAVGELLFLAEAGAGMRVLSPVLNDSGETINAQKLPQLLAELRVSGKKVVIKWNSSGFSGAGGWQWSGV